MLDNTLRQSLPVEAYLTNNQQYGQIQQAEAILVTACMKRFGFSYTPVVHHYTQQTSQTAHRYDPTDPAVAAARGYHRAALPTSAEPTAPPAAQTLPPDEQTVLGHGLGAPTASGGATRTANAAYHGITIPDGGCVGAAQQAMSAHGGLLQDAPQAVDLNFKDYTRSMSDPAVRAVFAKWSVCMKARGFNYPTPNAAVNDPRWMTAAPSASEIATASADVACKHRYNVIGTWFTVESAYERADIQANLREFELIRTAIATTLHNAEAVTEG